jgi:hypothetical protein
MDTYFYYILISLALFICIGSPIIIFCYDVCSKKNDENDNHNNVQFERKPLITHV